MTLAINGDLSNSAVCSLGLDRFYVLFLNSVPDFRIPEISGKTSPNNNRTHLFYSKFTWNSRIQIIWNCFNIALQCKRLIFVYFETKHIVCPSLFIASTKRLNANLQFLFLFSLKYTKFVGIKTLSYNVSSRQSLGYDTVYLMA